MMVKGSIMTGERGQAENQKSINNFLEKDSPVFLGLTILPEVFHKLILMKK